MRLDKETVEDLMDLLSRAARPLSERLAWLFLRLTQKIAEKLPSIRALAEALGWSKWRAERLLKAFLAAAADNACQDAGQQGELNARKHMCGNLKTGQKRPADRTVASLARAVPYSDLNITKPPISPNGDISPVPGEKPVEKKAGFHLPRQRKQRKVQAQSIAASAIAAWRQHNPGAAVPAEFEVRLMCRRLLGQVEPEDAALVLEWSCKSQDWAPRWYRGEAVNSVGETGKNYFNLADMLNPGKFQERLSKAKAWVERGRISVVRKDEVVPTKQKAPSQEEAVTRLLAKMATMSESDIADWENCARSGAGGPALAEAVRRYREKRDGQLTG